MRPIFIPILAVLGLLGGCVAPQSRRGRVVQANVGNAFSDFTFQDERGRMQNLSENLGDFTVLVFSECGTNLHGPASRALERLVHANQAPGYVETVGFDIHWSKDGCPYHSDCHLLEGGPRIFSICDARAQVRDLYRVNADDEIIVIGPDRRIISRTSMSGIESLSHALAYMFAEHAEMVIQTRSPDE